MSKSNNHATLLAHLYALRDMIHNPRRIISGDYELVQVLANNDERHQYNFYLREPRTNFYISADPTVFAVGNIDKLCQTNPINVFQRLAKICSLRLLTMENGDGWPFNDGKTTRSICKMSDIEQMLAVELKRTEIEPEESLLRRAFEENDWLDIYGFEPKSHNYDEGLIELLKKDSVACGTIRSALRMIKHNGVRKELIKDFECVVGTGWLRLL